LSPYKPVTTINAVLLTGGAAFGLAAADGVVNFMAERKIGHPTIVRPVPIVAASVINDMLLGAGKKPPGASLGYEACLAASEADPAQGNIGAGTGASVGKWSGFTTMMKGGFGLAKVTTEELIVFAAAVTNCVGDVIEKDGTVLAGARSEDGQWLSNQDPFRRFPVDPTLNRGDNTTLVVVGTNAILTKVEANRLAQRAHDGMAIAVRPTHTSFDGDTAYALATCTVDIHFDFVANMAAEMVAEAIRNSVRYARTVDKIPGLSDA
jgi:L-aminopeptidase/D-esterase-like protein